MRHIAEQHQTDPVDDHTFPDLMGQRYDALAAWSESAETMTMAAVRAEPSPAYASGAEADGPRHAAPSRRARVAVVAAAGVAVLAAATVMTWGGDETETPAVPVAAPVPVESAVEPAVETVPPPAPSASATPSPSKSPSRSAKAKPRLTVPTVRASRSTATAPAGGTPVLSASYGYQFDDTGYRGSVRVSNTGTMAATDWTVALTVPGAETVTVTSGAVTAGQSESSVTFRPSGAGVPASGSVSFSFTLTPAPTEPPTGCALDGQPCS
ncbi:hypothetical protein Aca07nite_22900 [Actinoplanes capillaceus]|uniref:CBM2 domain-containing protein n=2 Tax=Actinoplanes campanulatus TaxID=113559 RepID=A0ABQ3WEV5_9ACTN|nr:hypothetical protein Aca07nite_22900 [Actinoplanes capillaceus]